MNINSGISQYTNYVNNEAYPSTSSLSKDTVSNLKEGSVFEGSINSVDEKGRVIIGLSNGSTISARLDSGVSVSTGQSLFFQVKSNDGSLIQIRPVALDINSNPTLLKALDSASIMATEKTVSMVNLMMQESLPIDSESLASMNRLLLNNPTINPETIVTMTKLDLPVTTENANMFEAYSAGTQGLAQQGDTLATTIPEIMTDPSLSKEEAIGLNNSLNELFNALMKTEGESLIQGKESLVNNSPEIRPETTLSPEMRAEEELAESARDVRTELVQKEELTIETNSNTVANALTGKQLVSLQNILETFDDFSKGNEHMFSSDGSIKPSVTTSELFNSITNYLNNNPDVPKASVDDLFLNDSYKALLKDLITNSYSITPEKITKPGAIAEVFERVLKLSDTIEKLFSSSEGKAAETIKSATGQIRDNVNFMNSANEIYNFIQIPLKMYNQNTEGSLYVRQNKRKAYENGEEISCYLHFDMEYLGSTDIYIKLQKSDVNCQWHLADESSMKLIEAHIDILNDRLKKLGFNTTMEVSCDEKKVDFLKDFLRAEENLDAGAMLHRYSFDMKA